MTVCGRCERRLSERHAPTRLLPAVDFCGGCARPISERGRRLADNAGFIALAKSVLGRQPARSKTRTLADQMLVAR
jgi:hypothetical protein